VFRRFWQSRWQNPRPIAARVAQHAANANASDMNRDRPASSNCDRRLRAPMTTLSARAMPDPCAPKLARRLDLIRAGHGANADRGARTKVQGAWRSRRRWIARQAKRYALSGQSYELGGHGARGPRFAATGALAGICKADLLGGSAGEFKTARPRGERPPSMATGVSDPCSSRAPYSCFSRREASATRSRWGRRAASATRSRWGGIFGLPVVEAKCLRGTRRVARGHTRWRAKHVGQRSMPSRHQLRFLAAGSRPAEVRFPKTTKKPWKQRIETS
jgi:hypothetical protein